MMVGGWAAYIHMCVFALKDTSSFMILFFIKFCPSDYIYEFIYI